jgi:hypothetical protein
MNSPIIMQSRICIVLIHMLIACNAWNGILLDNNAFGGNTQLILPNSVPHTLGNVNYGLPHRYCACAVAHPDGNVYFMGGYDSSYSETNQVKRFDANTNVVTAAASMTVTRVAFAATIVGSTIVACGGELYCIHLIISRVGYSYPTSCEQSNPGVTSWTSIASLPTNFDTFEMVTLNGMPFAIGGSTNPTAMYALDTGSWVMKGSLSPGRYGHAAVALDTDRVLVCGGIVSSTAVNTCNIYTVSTDVWTTAHPMAHIRSDFNLIMSDSAFSFMRRL